MVASAGTLDLSEPSPEEVIAAAAELGAEITAHNSHRFTPEDLAAADLIIGMAREHVREVVLAQPAVFPRTFTLPGVVRRGNAVGRRGRLEITGRLARPRPRGSTSRRPPGQVGRGRHSRPDGWHTRTNTVRRRNRSPGWSTSSLPWPGPSCPKQALSNRPVAAGSAGRRSRTAAPAGRRPNDVHPPVPEAAVHQPYGQGEQHAAKPPPHRPAQTPVEPGSSAAAAAWFRATFCTGTAATTGETSDASRPSGWPR